MVGALAVLVALLARPRAQAATNGSYALVQDDGTLKVSGRIVRLFGIHIPETGRFFDTRRSPRVVSIASLWMGPAAGERDGGPAGTQGRDNAVMSGGS